MMVAFSVAMFANSYWYRGGDNSWGATAMTVSTDGLYEYIQSSNNANQFKIATSEDSWDYGWTYVQAGFNSTDVTNIGDYYPSMCQDAFNKRQTEIDVLNGKIAEYGKELGIPTPTCDVLSTIVRCIQDNYDRQF